MLKFRRKPIVIEAHQWHKNGDHPEDRWTSAGVIPASQGEVEGTVVRYYRTPALDGKIPCAHCDKIMHDHGWIDTLEGGHIVCPGDWIITGVAGERYPCKPDIFWQTYEGVDL